jgi:hypothetical protein
VPFSVRGSDSFGSATGMALPGRSGGRRSVCIRYGAPLRSSNADT